jgi:Domain of unknown function (DUF4157)
MAEGSPYIVAQRKQFLGMFGGAIQRKGREEEEPIQGRFDSIQRKDPEDEELQMKRASLPVQLKQEEGSGRNDTGLPDRLKAGIESLSGMSLDGVRVHYNSAQPAQLNALAYAQGDQIHVGPGQEKHLPHEAWHVVQQAQGRVKPTMQMKDGVAAKDDQTQEHESALAGVRAVSNLRLRAQDGESLQRKRSGNAATGASHSSAVPTSAQKVQPVTNTPIPAGAVVQLSLKDDLSSKKINVAIAGETHHEIDENLEIGSWDHAGIKVYYEADAIPVSGEEESPDVVPDPISLRVAFGWTALTERVSGYLKAAAEKGQEVDTTGFKDAEWVLRYLIPILIGDLQEFPDDPVMKNAEELLTELFPLLKNRLSQVGELERIVVASKLRRNMRAIAEHIKKIHAGSEFSKVPFASGDLRVERSRQMLQRVDNISNSISKTIYKVGDYHVLDIQANKWKPQGKVAVYDREAYKKEFGKIPKREKIESGVEERRESRRIRPGGAKLGPSENVPRTGASPAPVKVAKEKSGPPPGFPQVHEVLQKPGFGLKPISKEQPKTNEEPQSELSKAFSRLEKVSAVDPQIQEDRESMKRDLENAKKKYKAHRDSWVVERLVIYIERTIEQYEENVRLGKGRYSWCVRATSQFAGKDIDQAIKEKHDEPPRPSWL